MRCNVIMVWGVRRNGAIVSNPSGTTTALDLEGMSILNPSAIPVALQIGEVPVCADSTTTALIGVDDEVSGAGGDPEFAPSEVSLKLVKYAAENVIGSDTVFDSPFGSRKSEPDALSIYFHVSSLHH